ncbi:unnamed protein product [Candidula unifasciata]|uniref:Ankyrin repeat domain-containing protein 40 n=1 Tax=Candidula unifasciata TaxID=100452 RepID=A0A8S3ZZM1_9EUPU|nr:unnamed protein product [Candidula unifasciata]
MSLGDDIAERFREAACVGDLTLLTKLELQGVDLNSKNSMNGWTALHWACKRNHVAVVKYLLDRGADRNIKNKDGHTPAQLTSNEEIRNLLGVSSECEVKTTPLPILPNYLASPAFPYISNDRDNQSHFPVNSMYYKASGGDGRSVYTPTVSSSMSDELVLKARLANSDEKDFIEIELPRTQLHFAGLFSLMCAELGVDKSLVAKIRKLPDTIIRKDKDVKRLTDFQELELVLTNKAASAASRTYCLAPARNNETILY